MEISAIIFFHIFLRPLLRPFFHKITELATAYFYITYRTAKCEFAVVKIENLPVPSSFSFSDMYLLAGLIGTQLIYIGVIVSMVVLAKALPAYFITR